MPRKSAQAQAKRVARKVSRRIDPVREARAIRRLQKRVANHTKQVVADVAEIGKRLAKVRDGDALGHGQWLTWLKKNFAMSEDTAERYISVSRLGARNSHVRNLDLPLAVIYALARRNTPQHVIDEVIRRSEAGERVTRGQVLSLTRWDALTRVETPYEIAPSDPEPEPETNDDINLRYGRLLGSPVEPEPEPEQADARGLSRSLRTCPRVHCRTCGRSPKRRGNLM